MSAATVYLVGAGPGDVGLMTVRGRFLLERADAVVHDYLANPGLLALAPAGAERVYVGKEGFSAHIGQDELNGLLVDVARRVGARGGRTVVRLKGGDPFVFGRGGEEALALRAAGVPFEVVPGVTSGVAAPAYAGIPVTHRGIASTATFVTGHEDPAKGASGIDWPALAALARRGGTLCFYMGVRNLSAIAANLMGRGLPGDVPAAVVRWGTTARQQVLAAPLAEVSQRAREAGIGAPAIILVGEVADLRESLRWHEDRPLFGRRIVVTRSRAQAGALSGLLRELGADALEFPTIGFAAPDDPAPLDAAIQGIGGYDWVVFTSANGVDAFFDRLAAGAAPKAVSGSGTAGVGAEMPVGALPERPRNPAGRALGERPHEDVPAGSPEPYAGSGGASVTPPAHPRDARALAGARVAAIGPATARRLAERGIAADAVPGEYRGEAVFSAIERAAVQEGRSLEGARVLIPRAQEARAVLPQLLRDAGAQVDVVAAYKAVAPAPSCADAFATLLDEGVDAVTFTSSSTARNLLSLLGPRAGLLRRARLFSIGPITSRTLADAGFPPDAEARSYTIPGLVDAIVDHMTI